MFHVLLSVSFSPQYYISFLATIKNQAWVFKFLFLTGKFFCEVWLKKFKYMFLINYLF